MDKVRLLQDLKDDCRSVGWDGYIPAIEALEAENAAMKALLAGKVLCNAEPIGYLYQHEDTGMTASVDVQQVEWGFEKNNPRYTLVGPLHKPADIGKEDGE
jgi:hypothetical protein